MTVAGGGRLLLFRKQIIVNIVVVSLFYIHGSCQYERLT